MDDDNRISASITDDELAQYLDHIKAIHNALNFLVSLTPEQRLKLPKMGDKTIGFEENTAVHMRAAPEFMPGFLSLEEIDKDRRLRAQVRELYAAVTRLQRSLDDTIMQLSSEIYRADLAYYRNVSEAARRGRHGAQAIYEELRTRFPGAGSSKDDQLPAPDPTPAPST